MNLGRSHPDHLVLVIDGNRILVAKVGFLLLLGPAGLGILLQDAVDEQCVQPHRFIRTAQCLDQLRLGQYRVSVFGRNLSDEDYFTQVFAVPVSEVLSNLGTPREPQVWGVQLSVDF